MSEGQVFDKLVADLSEGERRDLFERLKQSIPHSQEPLIKAEGSEDIPRKEELYHKQGLFSRLLCIILGFLSQATPEEVFGRRLIKQLRNSLEIRFPSLAEYREENLSSGFFDEIQRLKAASRYFYPAFELGMDKDKPAFISFLAGFNLEETEVKIKSSCDPLILAQANPDLEGPQLIKSAVDAIEDAISLMPDPDKRAVYSRVRSLTSLRKLVSYPFDRISAYFTLQGGRRLCPYALALPLLSELADILSSLAEPLSVELIEALFAFPLRMKLSETEEILKKDLVKAEAAINEIRLFGEHVPLVELIRLMSSTLEYRPTPLPAGEDWLPLYRSWWKSWAEGRFNSYMQDRSRNRVMNEISEFLKGKSLIPLEYINSDGREGKFPLKHDLLLRFALSAMEITFQEEMNRPLKLILLEGQFYRQDNRIEYTDAYSRIMRVADSIRALDKKLSLEGELGKRYEEAKSDMGSGATMRQRRLTSIQQAAAGEAEAILGSLLSASRTGINLIRGILSPQSGNRYDSLHNLETMDGRNNAAFRESLARTKDRLERIVTIMLTLSESDSIKIPE